MMEVGDCRHPFKLQTLPGYALLDGLLTRSCLMFYIITPTAYATI
jgi:hypothetical protein